MSALLSSFGWLQPYVDALRPHFIVLLVVVPLMAAPLVMLIGRNFVGFVLTVLACVFSFFASLMLLLDVLRVGVVSYHIGGWAPPAGIEYRADAANAFVVLIVSAIGTVVLPYARTSIRHEIAERHHALFYACYLLCFTGLLGVAITGDAFNVFVFLEISALSTYVLVALGAEKDKRALSAAYDYLILGTIGATFFVIGLGMLYMATGTLNMVDLADRLGDMQDNRTVRSAFAFITIGMGLKIAMYPLHRWLPGAYTFSPSVVSAFLAGTATKVAVYVLLRFMFSVFSARFGFEVDTLEFIILPLAVVAMFAASFVATFQDNFKRLLAYSSVAQIGYMLLGISLLNVTGVSAAMVHLFNHAITKTALFLAVGAIVYRTGSPIIPRMAGLGRLMPFTSAAIVLGGLSLIGIPSTAGFVSKFALLSAALEKGWWPVAFLIVASSMIAVLYVWKVVETLYLKQPEEGVAVREAPLMLLLPTWILVGAIFWFGIDADFTMSAAQTAAESLLAGNFGGTDGATVFGEPGRTGGGAADAH